MNDDIREELKGAFTDPEYRHAYASSFLNTSIAAQIKALREARGLTQEELGRRAGMAQESICRLENVNYSSWSITTLRRLAQAFDLALVVRFDGFGSLLDDIVSLSREALERPSFADDTAFQHGRDQTPSVASAELTVRGDAISDLKTSELKPVANLASYRRASSKVSQEATTSTLPEFEKKSWLTTSGP